MVIDSQTSCVPQGGGQERCVLGDRVCRFVGIAAWLSDKMYMIMIF